MVRTELAAFSFDDAVMNCEIIWSVDLKVVPHVSIGSSDECRRDVVGASGQAFRSCRRQTVIRERRIQVASVPATGGTVAGVPVS